MCMNTYCSFVAVETNGTGLSPAHQVSVTLCSSCSQHGECIWDSQNEVEGYPGFFLRDCDCRQGYAGKNIKRTSVSLSSKIPYHKISWSLEATRFRFILLQSLWNLTDSEDCTQSWLGSWYHVIANRQSWLVSWYHVIPRGQNRLVSWYHVIPRGHNFLVSWYHVIPRGQNWLVSWYHVIPHSQNWLVSWYHVIPRGQSWLVSWYYVIPRGQNWLVSWFYLVSTNHSALPILSTDANYMWLILNYEFITGSDCEIDIDGCSENPCAEFTGAACIDHTPEEVANHSHEYSCTQCPSGFSLFEGLGPCQGKLAIRSLSSRMPLFPNIAVGRFQPSVLPCLAANGIARFLKCCLCNDPRLLGTWL